jgi:hypothetical protein
MQYTYFTSFNETKSRLKFEYTVSTIKEERKNIKLKKRFEAEDKIF